MAINDRPVVVDFIVDQDAMVWPMVAAGTSNDEIQVARDMAPDWDSEADELMTRHTLSVLVENKPGVLARVAGLFSPARLQHRLAGGGPDRARRRLAHDDRRQRRGAAARAGHQAAQQAGQRAQDRRARPVDRPCSASCCWSRSRADRATRSHVLETVQLFRAKVVDVAPDAVTIEATGNADKLDALLRVLEPFGIRELVQSGMVAVGRGPRSITDRARAPPVDRVTAALAR